MTAGYGSVGSGCSDATLLPSYRATTESMEAFSEFDLEAIFDDEPPPPDRSYHGLARSGETAARAAECK